MSELAKKVIDDIKTERQRQVVHLVLSVGNHVLWAWRKPIFLSP